MYTIVTLKAHKTASMTKTSHVFTGLDRACGIRWVTPSRPLRSRGHALICPLTRDLNTTQKLGLEGLHVPNLCPDRAMAFAYAGVRGAGGPWAAEQEHKVQICYYSYDNGCRK